jgi:hypothetical protein
LPSAVKVRRNLRHERLERGGLLGVHEAGLEEERPQLVEGRGTSVTQARVAAAHDQVGEPQAQRVVEALELDPGAEAGVAAAGVGEVPHPPLAGEGLAADADQHVAEAHAAREQIEVRIDVDREARRAHVARLALDRLVEQRGAEHDQDRIGDRRTVAAGAAALADLERVGQAHRQRSAAHDAGREAVEAAAELEAAAHDVEGSERVLGGRQSERSRVEVHTAQGGVDRRARAIARLQEQPLRRAAPSAPCLR